MITRGTPSLGNLHMWEYVGTYETNTRGNTVYDKIVKIIWEIREIYVRIVSLFHFVRRNVSVDVIGAHKYMTMTDHEIIC